MLHYFPARGRAEPIRCGDVVGRGRIVEWVRQRCRGCIALSANQHNVHRSHTHLELTQSHAQPTNNRLALALARQPWFEPPVEPLAAVVRCQLDSFPFRQLPRLVDEGGVDLVQSMVGVLVV